MKSDDQALQIEITIVPPKGRQRHSVGGPKAPDPPRIPRIARLMALAIKFQDMVDRGEVRDYADLARLGYVSRARITQIMNLLNLAPGIQEQILAASGNVANPALTERHLRCLASAIEWSEQRSLWEALTSGWPPYKD